MAKIFDINWAESENSLEFDFLFETSKVWNENEKALESCSIGAYGEVANRAGRSFNWLAAVGKFDADNVHGSYSKSEEQAVTDGPANIGEEQKESPTAWIYFFGCFIVL